MHGRIVVVGSLNADFVLRVPHFPKPGETLTGETFQVFPGGKGANQAYAAARLGAAVHMVGQVGADVQGPALKQNLAAAGVDVSGVDTDHRVSTGIATITIDAAGQNQIIIIGGANATLGLSELERSRALIASARFLLLQLEIPLPTVTLAARWGHEAGATVILDPAPARPLPDDLLSHIDYLTPNETELGILTGTSRAVFSPVEAAEAARLLLARGVRNVLVKLGAQGALLVRRTTDQFWPGFAVKAVDTTAAGDVFNGAFAAALARGALEIEAGRFAAAAAAISVTRPGAQPSMPSLSEVESMLGKPA